MNGVTPDVLALPKGGGAVGGLGGGFTPDLNTGGGGYAVPLDLPQGVDGHTPRLTLQYSTGFGAGPFGLGWALPVLAVELDTSGRLPRYDGSDPFALPGAGRLVAVPQEPGRLVPETDGLGWRIRHHGDGFEATDRSGVRHVLGTTPTARVSDPDDPTRVYSWRLERSIRPTGEEIAYAWSGPLLAEVAWATYRLTLSYEDRPDPIVDGRPGFLVTTAQRCVTVDLSNDGELVRRYTLDYQLGKPTGHSLLAGITLSGHADGAVATFPRLAFGYTASTFALRAADPTLCGILTRPGGTVADLSGDGLPDAVQLNGSSVLIARNRGGLAFDAPRRLSRIGPTAPPSGVTIAADLTGRGRVDLVSVGAGRRYRYPVDGPGVLGRPVVGRYLPSVAPWNPGVRLLDLDGDGAADILSIVDDVMTTVSTDESPDWRDVARRAVGSDHPLAGVDLRAPDMLVAPMTGDGLADLVQVRSGRMRYWPNLGNGRWGGPRVMVGSPVLPAKYRLDRLFLVDVDGDGCADLVYVDRDAARVWLNLNGARFSAEITVRPVPGLLADRVEPVDLRGTGCAGLLLAFHHGGRARAYHLDLEAKPYLLNHVDDGLGHTVTIEYGSSVEESRRDDAAGRPWPTSLPFPVPVVRRVVQTRPGAAPQVSRFAYHRGHWDPALRRFLGFAQVDEVEEGDATVVGLIKRTEFHLGRTPQRVDQPATPAERLAAQVLRGRVVRSSGYSAGVDPTTATPLFEVRQSWQAHITDVGGATVASPQLVERREDHLDGAPAPWRSTVTTTHAWDAFGNITDQTQRDELAADPSATQTLRTVTSYATDPTAWIVDRPARITQTDRTGAAVDVRVLRYDGPALTGLPEGQVSQGLVTAEERLAVRDDQVAGVYGHNPPDLAALGYHHREGGWWVHTRRYDRTAPGTLVSLDPRGNAVWLELDADRLFPVRHSDSRGNVIEATVDRRAMRLASLSDGNGGTRSNSYDALGRLVAEYRPGDEPGAPTVTYDYLLGSAPVVRTTEFPGADRTDAVTTTRLVDSDGREIGAARLDGDGTWIVSSAVWRNARGLAARVFLPYRTDDPRTADLDQPHAATTFDALGRPLRTELPDGSVRLGTHAPGRSDLVDEEGQRTLFELDAAGRVRRTTIGPASTAYVYDMRDQLVELTDPNGRLVSITYDLLGNRIRVDDPATGPVVFVHDAAGNLVERRNALGQLTRHTYDVLNRLVRTSQPEQPEVVYRYADAADPGGAGPGRRLGRLAQVEDVRGTTTFDYDVRGQVTGRRLSVGGRSYVIQRRTDRLGRLVSVGYPGATADTPGPVLTYSYDRRGLLRSVSGVVDRIEYDVSGAPVATQYAGGVREVRSYDGLGRIATLEVQDAAGQALSREVVTRDRAGHVTAVIAPTVEDTWTYRHDDRYQLVRAEQGGGVAIDYAYDAAGNLTFRSDVGTFTYGEAGAPATALTTAGPNAYGYDAAGRQTSGPAGSFAYDALDRLVRLSGAAGASLTIDYGAFGERAVYTESTGGATRRTVFLDDLVELRGNSLVYHITDGHQRIGQLTPGGPVACWHTDHRGSVTLVTVGAGTVAMRLSYDPYGRVLAIGSGDRPRATYDGYDLLGDFGLYLSPKRPYDPALGRFLVADTVVSDLWHPVGANRYAYAANDPVTVRDPSGRAWWHYALAALAVVAVVALTVVTFGVGAISLGAMIGVFAAMAGGAVVGGIAAARAGGDIGLGILLGAALAGAAALGAALAGAGFAAAWGAKAFATHVLAGAVSGTLLGAATGFAAGWAGGQGELGDVWERTWKSALVGLVTGLAFGVGSYGFQQGWFGTGNIKPHLPTAEETGRAAAAGAKAAGDAANAGAGPTEAAIEGGRAATTSLTGSMLGYGSASGFNVLNAFVFNPVAGTLLIQGVSSVVAFDLQDELIKLIDDKVFTASG